MNIPFIETVPEESREAVTTFVTNTGASEQDLAPYKSYGEFLSGYKPKAPLAPEWTSTLSAEERSLIGVKGWKTPSDALKGYNELERFVGHDKIAMPRKDKDGNFVSEDMNRVFDQLGRPKEAGLYTLPKDFKPVEGAALTEESLTNFKAEAHKLGLLPGQYQGIVNHFNTLLAQGKQAEAENKEKAFNESQIALRIKWGANYDAKAQLANTVLKGFTDKKQAQAIVDKYGNDPVIIELLAEVGENLSEDTIQRANMKGSLMTPEAADIEIKKIMSDPNHPYFKNTHPEHTYWVNRITELYRMKGE